MAVVFLTKDTLPQYRQRLDRIKRDSRPKWGSMDSTKLMAHLTRSIELSLGEHPVTDRSNIITRTALKWMVFHVVKRMPKGAKAPPVFHPAPEGDFAAERARLDDALDRFVRAVEETPDKTAVSEIFGPATLKYYERVHGIHLGHHLKQFGV